MAFLIFIAIVHFPSVTCENGNSSDLLLTEVLLPNFGRQGENELKIDVESLAAMPGDGEQRCVKKVVMQEQTEWDQTVECHHRF